MKYFYLILLIVFFIGCKENLEIGKNKSKNVEEKRTITSVDYSEFLKIIEQKETIILDIRTLQEFDSGHVKDAINIDFYAPDFKTLINKLDKSQKYLIYCRSGNRSGKALAIMDNLKFVEVYNLLGGVNKLREMKYTLE